MRFNGVDIEGKTEVKYLGIIPDKKLMWNKPLEVTVDKTTSALMVRAALQGGHGDATQSYCSGCTL